MSLSCQKETFKLPKSRPLIQNVHVHFETTIFIYNGAFPNISEWKLCHALFQFTILEYIILCRLGYCSMHCQCNPVQMHWHFLIPMAMFVLCLEEFSRHRFCTEPGGQQTTHCRLNDSIFPRSSVLAEIIGVM